jgi:putative proteasome-type protease
LYSRGSFDLVEHRYHRDDLQAISAWWQERMRRSVEELPSEWIEDAFSRLMRQAAAL